MEAAYGLLPDGRGVVEMAQASGIWRVAEAERDAWAASTRGTGELIAAAAEAGASEVIVTVGGSATTDGGAGCIEALKEAGVEVSSSRSSATCAPRSRTPPASSARRRAPTPAMVERLATRLDRLAARAPRDPRGVPMTGCAGGLSGGLYGFRGARLRPGAAYVLDAVGFDRRASAARLVITGEGKLDRQTLSGKAVGEVAARSRAAGIGCHAVVGVAELDEAAAAELGLAGVREATRPGGARRGRAGARGLVPAALDPLDQEVVRRQRQELDELVRQRDLLEEPARLRRAGPACRTTRRRRSPRGSARAARPRSRARARRVTVLPVVERDPVADPLPDLRARDLGRRGVLHQPVDAGGAVAAQPRRDVLDADVDVAGAAPRA